MNRPKIPKAAFAPESRKRPRMAPLPVGAAPNGHPTWRLHRLDFDGPWCSKAMTQTDLLRVVDRLRHLEKMNWREILGRDHHEIPVESLCREAQERLRTMGIDDIDSVLSIRVTGRERIRGYRLDGVVLLLWWDPDHQACPATLRGT